jgi:hypothetical protein
MNTPLRLLSLAMLCVALRANAQQPAPAADPAKPPPKATPQSEAGEPRADTSATPAPAVSSPQSEAGEPRANTSRPAAARSPAAGARTPPGPGTAAKNPGASDRLELGTATVTGDREQPKVLYIVPWKKPDIGDLAGKPLNSLVDEILAPVDRDVFKREVVYYKAVQADASQNGAPSHPPQQGEK